MKDIPGWEGLYAVTKDGRVWAHPRSRIRNGLKIPYPGYWRKTSVNPQGYITIALHRGGSRLETGAKSYRVHQLVALTYLPKVNGKPIINHKNGIKSDNRVSNLEWCTYKENTVHALKNGLRFPPKGESHGMAKLNENTIREIRKLYAGGVRVATIAKKFGLSKTHTSKIVKLESWKHVV